jgi:hypothetical protein
MTDPESILQLGIEAVKDGNKEEARNLFRTLTRQTPENVQGWLWLAGVAENRDERKGSLERVLDLDPQNVVALKSLQVLQEDERATRQQPDTPVAAPPSAPAVPPSEPAPSPASSAVGDERETGMDESDPFSELDSLSDVFSEDPHAVGREAPPPKETTAATASASREKQVIPRSSWSRGYGDSHKKKGDERPMEKPATRGLLPIVVGVVAIVVVGLLVWRFVLPMFLGGEDVAQQPAPQPTAQDAGTGTQPDTDEGQPGDQDEPADQAETAPAPTPAEAGGGETVPDQPAPAAPATATPETPRPVNGGSDGTTPDPAAANPTLLPPNAPIESNGWLYDFQNQRLATAFPGNIGNFQPQGRFVHVLLMVVNRTGQDQPLPPDFVVLKDAQGRVYSPLPEVSSAFVIRGVNADVGHQDVIPANGLTTSVALIFDVALDASNLVLFAPSHPSEGWLVLERVQ